MVSPLVFSVVASSPPPTTSMTSSSTTRRCASCAYGLHQAVRVLRHPLRAAPSCRLDCPALCRKIRALLLASSSIIAASVAITSTPSNSRLRHLLPRHSSAPATAMEAFSAGPPATASGCASSLARSVLATPVRAHRPRRIPEPGKLGHVSPNGLTTSTSASLSLRLPRRVAIFVSGVFSIMPPP